MPGEDGFGTAARASGPPVVGIWALLWWTGELPVEECFVRGGSVRCYDDDLFIFVFEWLIGRRELDVKRQETRESRLEGETQTREG